MRRTQSDRMPWDVVFREGFAPLFSDDALQALRVACETDDPRLIQGGTTVPPPLQCVADWPCEGACAIGFAGWQGERLERVGEVEEFFARKCFEADQRIGEPAACRYWLDWFDDSPRGEVLAGLLAEVEREQKRRAAILA